MGCKVRGGNSIVAHGVPSVPLRAPFTLVRTRFAPLAKRAYGALTGPEAGHTFYA